MKDKKIIEEDKTLNPKAEVRKKLSRKNCDRRS
jgi:hypothetical protein